MTDDLRGGTPEAARAPRRWWLAKECQRAADYGNNKANRCDASLATHAYNVPASAVSSRSELSRHFAGAHPSLIILDLHEIAFAPRPGHYNAGHGRRSSNLARFCPAIAAGRPPSSFRNWLFMPRGGSPNIPWLWALRGRLGVVGYLRLRFARFGSHAGERGSEQRGIIAAPNCRIGVTLLRLVDDDHALPAHAERAPIVQCFERLNC